MKKFLIGVLVVLVLISLVGCRVEVGPTVYETKNVEEVKTDETGEIVEKTKLTDEEMYGGIIEDYKKAMEEYDLEDLDSEERIENSFKLVSLNLLMHVARYERDGVKLTYRFYDIDKNGTNELLVCADNGIGAIYSYDFNFGKPVKIFFQETLERGNLAIYDNGIVLSEGSGGAALHYYEFGKIDEDGITYKMLEYIEEEYMEDSEIPVYRDANTRKELEYTSLSEIMEKYVGSAEMVDNSRELKTII